MEERNLLLLQDLAVDNVIVTVVIMQLLRVGLLPPIPAKLLENLQAGIA
jgi:hypothetical protein